MSNFNIKKMGSSRIWWILFGTIVILLPSRIISSEGFCELRTSCSECIQNPSCYWCLESGFIWGDSKCFETSEIGLSLCAPENIFNPKNSHVSNQNDSQKVFQNQVFLFRPRDITVKLDRVNVPYKINFDYNHIIRWSPLVSSVEMIHESPVNVDVNISCLDNRGLPSHSSKCDSTFSFGNIHHFEIELKLIECTNSGSPGVIKIYPRGISENLIINLELSCTCPCDNPHDSTYIANATQCNYHGDLKCGSCLCNSQYSGSTCDCLENEETQNKCLAPNSTDICSKRGTCSCGKCVCDFVSEPGMINGKFCENEEPMFDESNELDDDMALADQQMPQLEKELVAPFAGNPSLQQRSYPNPCQWKSNCRECIQTPNCAWCSDPLLRSSERCIHNNSPYNTCSKEFLYNPLSYEMILSRPGYNSYTPSGLKIIKEANYKLRANQPLEVLMNYTHTQTSKGLFFTISGAKDLNVRSYVKCSRYDFSFKETNRCDYLQYRSTVQIKLTVEFTSCGSIPQLNWNQNVTIRPAGTNEIGLINLELLCECPCEKVVSWEHNRLCNNHGTHKCGICECFSGFTGKTCENSNLPSSTCRPHPQSSHDCSGRGRCYIGKCICNQGYAGAYCEKLRSKTLSRFGGEDSEEDDTIPQYRETLQNNVQVLIDSCTSPYNALRCSGTGSCYNDRCYCNQGYQGQYCETPTSTQARGNLCLNENDQRICSNVGVCRNDRCVCPPDHTGRYCEVSQLPIQAQISDPCLSPSNNKICSERGECRYDRCVCYSGFQGEHCDQYGTSAIQTPSQSRVISDPCMVPGTNIKCSGRGWCINENRCQCNAESIGQYCETLILPSTSGCLKDNKICSGIGRCRDNRCECPADNGGQFCEINYFRPVVPIPLPKNPCLSPINNKTCSERGQCKNNQCVCYEGFYGEFCSQYNSSASRTTTITSKPQVNPCLLPGSRIECSGRGWCRNNRCECASESTGQYCEQERPIHQPQMNPCVYPGSDLECSGKGWCVRNHCECVSEAIGQYCEQEKVTTSPTIPPPSQPPSPANPCIRPGSIVECSRRGWCRSNRCECAPEASGQYCEQEIPTTPPPIIPRPLPETSISTCLYPGSRTPCSGRGWCRNNRCECAPEAAGQYCEQGKPAPSPEIYPPTSPPPLNPCIRPGSDVECSRKGWCISKRCKCVPESTGEYCEKEIPAPTNPPVNFCVRPGSGIPCSGRGRCNNNRCECSPEVTGQYCEQPKRPATLPTNFCLSPLTNSDCSGRGTCYNNTCVCSENFSGRYCEQWTAIPATPVDRCRSPSSTVECSGVGRCLDGRCSCPPGVTGQFCDVSQIVNATPSYPGQECLSPYNQIICSGRGECRNGRCECFEYFDGQHCERIPQRDTCLNPNTKLICSNNGQCQQGRCVCSQYHSGEYCEEIGIGVQVNVCMNLQTGLQCSGNGVCYHGQCVCNSGATGALCESQIQSPCQKPGTNVNCSNAGQCQEGVCRCVNGRTGQFCEVVTLTAEQPCLSPYNNQNCSGRGQCDRDLCRCYGGFTGKYCENSVPSTSQNSVSGVEQNRCVYPNDNRICLDRGVCYENRCHCTPPYTGEYCQESERSQQPNPADNTKCSGRGTFVGNRCVCQSYFHGQFCEQYQPPTSDCMNPTTNVECSGNGKCLNGRCGCFVEFLGQYCETPIEIPTPGPEPQIFYCRPLPNSLEECSGRGRCRNGQCQCYQGFEGTMCEKTEMKANVCINPLTQEECSRIGRCIENRCECPRGYSGQYCEKDEEVVQTANYCVNPQNQEVCSRIGSCINNACVCPRGYEGQYCEKIQLQNDCQNPRTREDCSRVGRCVNNTCECIRGHSGRYCEIRETTVLSSPNDCKNPQTQEECSKIGRCVDNRCECPIGYRGQYCNEVESQSQGYCRPPWSDQDCSQRGRCVNGRCECYDRFTGDFCEKDAGPSTSSGCKSPYGNLDCDGKGTCVNDKCRCDDGFNGDFCEVRIVDHCMSPFVNVHCSGHGTCINDQCSCPPEYTGQYCERPVKAKWENPQNNRCISPYNRLECSGLGRCYDNRCMCSPGYSGAYCEATDDVSKQPQSSDSHCMNPTNGTICSGRGTCVEGRCECEIRRNSQERIYGMFCECDNYSCERSDGLLCGGHGTCTCGQCECLVNWTGPGCSNFYSTPNSTCSSPYSPPGTVCSGRGTCEYGVCSCLYGSTGRYCEQPQAEDRCMASTSCTDCIQSPTCAWCKDPNLRAPRCIQSTNLTTLSQLCRPEYIVNPDNAVIVLMAQPMSPSKDGNQQPSRSLINPQRIALKLRPHQSHQISMQYSHKLNFFAYVQPSTVQLEHNATSDITVRFSTPCLHVGGQFTERNECQNVEVGDIIPFKIDLEVVRCPSDPRDWNQLIKIAVKGHDETLNLEVDLLCGCPCDKNIESSVECNLRGTLKCGICVCSQNFEGEFCQHMKTVPNPPSWPLQETTINPPAYYPYPQSLESSPQYYSPSAASNQNYGCYYPGMERECSGNGVCEVGRCQCRQPYTGTFCQEAPPQPQSSLQSSPTCASRSTCARCMEDSSCSWCKDTSSCLDTSSADRYCKNLHNPGSSIEYIGTSSKSIRPDSLSIVLRPGQPLRVPVDYMNTFSPTPWGRPSTLELTVNQSRYVSTKLFTNCLNKNGPLDETNRCENIGLGDVIGFEIEFEMASNGCPREEEWLQTVQIRRVGLNATLNVEIEFICDCSCDDAGDETENRSPKCNYRGTYSCGECICDDGFSGDKCEKKSYDNEDDYDDDIETECISVSGRICSGQGSCLNGRCMCNVGWSGDNCSCTTSQQSCTDERGQICSGNGVCSCGKCQCSQGFVGQRCETCNSWSCGGKPLPILKAIETASETCSNIPTCDECIKNPICSYCLDSGECLASQHPSTQCRQLLVLDPRNPRYIPGITCPNNEIVDAKECVNPKTHTICSNRGICTQGRCSCRPGWSGDDCSCSESDRTCAPGVVCLGRGMCKCGRCECPSNSYGDSCEIGPSSNVTSLLQTSDQICASKSTCHECIQTSNCSWCNDPVLTDTPRCYDPSFPKPIRDQCRGDFVHNPDNEMRIVPADRSLLYAQNNGGTGASYQRVHVKLRLNQPFTVQLFWNHHPNANSWFRSSVELQHSASENLRIRFLTNCLDREQPLFETNKCTNLPYEGLIQFNVEITVLRCPSDKRNWRETFNISPVGSDENFIIDSEMICDCPCENLDRINYRNRSRECSEHGTYSCGVCLCNPGFSGNTCELYSAQTQQLPSANYVQQCADSSEKCYDTSSNLMCSGHGRCSCGQCECDPGYVGRFCEYCQGCNQTLPSISKSTQSDYEICSSKISCESCIQTSTCAWCNDPNFRAPYKCFQYANQSIYQCREEYVTNPTNSITSLDLGDFNAISAHMNQVQIFPKRLNLKLRPNTPQSLDLALVAPKGNNIVPYLHLLHDTRGFVNIRYFSNCQSDIVKETAKCTAVEPGSLISFNVSIELVQCPRDDREWKQSIRIYPAGVASTESTTIDVEMLCGCSCTQEIAQAKECNYRGTYKCGRCECDRSMTGTYCETEVSDSVCPNSIESCRNPLAHTPEEFNRICSGRGDCKCGNCVCQKYFKGTYCENYCPSCTSEM